MAHVVLIFEIPKAERMLGARLSAALRKLNYHTNGHSDVEWYATFTALGERKAIDTAKADFARCAARAGISQYTLQICASRSSIELETWQHVRQVSQREIAAE